MKGGDRPENPPKQDRIPVYEPHARWTTSPLADRSSKWIDRKSRPCYQSAFSDREGFFAIFELAERVAASVVDSLMESWQPKVEMIFTNWSKLARPGAASMAAKRRWLTPIRRPSAACDRPREARIARRIDRK